MPDTSRIARNTLFLYFRQILIMAVSLYTVRVVLAVLGAEDYGIYNVVAGVVVLFGFVNGAMEASDEVLLYLCTESPPAQNAEVVRLGTSEIRKYVVVYYESLAEELGVRLRVEYEADAGLVSEDELGYERVG